MSNAVYVHVIGIFMTICCISVKGVIQTVSMDKIPHNDKSRAYKTDKLFCYYILPNLDHQEAFPSDLNATLCSHVIFIPVRVTRRLHLTAGKNEKFLLYVVPVLRRLNPSLKILVSHAESQSGFVPILSSAKNSTVYVNSAVPFLRKYNLDGLDLDWEFPGVNMKQNFSLILADLQRAFINEKTNTKRPKLLLTAAVSAGESLLRIYDITAMGTSLDYVNMMGYDYHEYSPGERFTNYNSPLFASSHDNKTVDSHSNLAWSANMWVQKGIPKRKMIIGVPLYGHTYTLKSSKLHGFISPAISKGECDSCGYIWACDALLRKNATRVFDTKAMVPYAYFGNQWISYDDVESLAFKTKWAIKNNFGGMMVWQMTADDSYGECGLSKEKFPLLSAMHNLLFN